MNHASESWEAVIERKNPDCDTIRPTLTAYGVRMGDEVLWVHTATDLTLHDVRDKYRCRCQLMAGAPDLLDAAKAALAALQRCCDAGIDVEFRREAICTGQCSGCAIAGARELLQAAIAKAEGRGE